MSPLAKGREALANLPTVVQSHLPPYNTVFEPTLEQLCHDLASADHHTIAVEIKEKNSVLEMLASMHQEFRQEIQQAAMPRSQNPIQSGTNSSNPNLPRNFTQPSSGPIRSNPSAPNATMMGANLKFVHNTFADSEEGHRLYAAAIA